MYLNPLYLPNRGGVLWPAHHVRDIRLWNEVYLGHMNAVHDWHLAAGMEVNNNGDNVDADESKLNLADMSVVSKSEVVVVHNPTAAPQVSPVSKTRSYEDLSGDGGSTTEPQRRCSDPTVPKE